MFDLKLVKELTDAVDVGDNLRRGGLKRLLLPSKFLRYVDDQSQYRDWPRFRNAILELKSGCDAAGVELGFRLDGYGSGPNFDLTIWDPTHGKPRLNVLRCLC